MWGLLDSIREDIWMTSERVNYLSIGLMAASALAALVLPFEVFLVSYAVLGPLHYLTEISWLHDRGYFLTGKRDSLPLMLLCGAMLLVSVVRWPGAEKNDLITMLNYMAFAGAAALLITRTKISRVIAFALVMGSFLIVSQSDLSMIFFGVFLPTIVHVFIFTGAFILLGALRGRSKSGVISAVVFAVCAVGLLMLPAWSSHQVSSYVRGAYAPFEHLNESIFRVFHLATDASKNPIFASPQGIAVMRFIAFAYLYHYLNWFSKTSIIKWNRITMPRAIAIVAMWIALLAMYANDSRTGVVVLMVLSFVHGFLELPLDHLTFFSIFKEMHALAGEHSRRAQSTNEVQSDIAA